MGNKLCVVWKREIINTMIGVVLWKNTDDGSAVIWCEDQGDLAYMNSDADVLNPQAFFDVGDVVEFDVLVLKNMRGVQNLCRLQDPSRPELPKRLRQSGVNTVSKGAEIIQFTGPQAHCEPADEVLPTRGRLA